MNKKLIDSKSSRNSITDLSRELMVLRKELEHQKIEKNRLQLELSRHIGIKNQVKTLIQTLIMRARGSYLYDTAKKSPAKAVPFDKKLYDQKGDKYLREYDRSAFSDHRISGSVLRTYYNKFRYIFIEKLLIATLGIFETAYKLKRKLL